MVAKRGKRNRRQTKIYFDPLKNDTGLKSEELMKITGDTEKCKKLVNGVRVRLKEKVFSGISYYEQILSAKDAVIEK